MDRLQEEEGKRLVGTSLVGEGKRLEGTGLAGEAGRHQGGGHEEEAGRRPVEGTLLAGKGRLEFPLASLICPIWASH